MRRSIAFATLAVASFGVAGAHAGAVCLNNNCRNAPGVYGSVNASATGQVKVSGGVTGGPGLGTTGINSIVVKPDDVEVRPLVGGADWGRYGYSYDGEYGALRVYLGANGCRQYGDGTFGGACKEHTP